MSKTTYILLKDYQTITHSYKAGTDIAFYGGMYRIGFETFSEDQIKANPDWFKLKEEQPKEEDGKKVDMRFLMDEIGQMPLVMKMNGSKTRWDAFKMAYEKTWQKSLEEVFKNAQEILDWVNQEQGKSDLMPLRRYRPDFTTEPREQSKSTPKEEPLTVRNFDRDMGYRYNLIMSGNIPPEKYEAVKKAIEFVLQNESYYMKSYPGERLCTEKECLEREEEAFNAGKLTFRGQIPYEPNGERPLYSKYDTFSDYKNQK